MNFEKLSIITIIIIGTNLYSISIEIKEQVEITNAVKNYYSLIYNNDVKTFNEYVIIENQEDKERFQKVISNFKMVNSNTKVPDITLIIPTEDDSILDTYLFLVQSDRGYVPIEYKVLKKDGILKIVFNKIDILKMIEDGYETTNIQIPKILLKQFLEMSETEKEHFKRINIQSAKRSIRALEYAKKNGMSIIPEYGEIDSFIQNISKIENINIVEYGDLYVKELNNIIRDAEARINPDNTVAYKNDKYNIVATDFNYENTLETRTDKYRTKKYIIYYILLFIIISGVSMFVVKRRNKELQMHKL